MILCERHKGDLLKLKASYDNLPWYSKWLFPGVLAAKLNEMDGSNPSAQSAFEVCQAYINHTWFFHTWFFVSLSDFATSMLIRAFKALNTVGLLSGGDARNNFNAVANCENAYRLANILKILHNSGLLVGEDVQANLEAAANAQNLFTLLSILEILDTYFLLSGDDAQDNFNLVANHNNPRALHQALSTVSFQNLLLGDDAQNNFKLVAKHQKPDEARFALEILNESGCLAGHDGQANREAIAKHREPEVLAFVLRHHSSDLMTGDNGQAYRKVVVNNKYPASAVSALYALKAAHLIGVGIEQSQARLDALITYQDILFHEVTYGLWEKIPRGALTKDCWDRIIQCCSNSEGTPEMRRQQVIDYVQCDLIGDRIEVETGRDESVDNKASETDRRGTFFEQQKEGSAEVDDNSSKQSKDLSM